MEAASRAPCRVKRRQPPMTRDVKVAAFMMVTGIVTYTKFRYRRVLKVFALWDTLR